MNNKLRVTKNINNSLTYLLLISILYFFSTFAQAQEDIDWWFDVEILIFKHNNAQDTVTEQFDTEVDKPFSPRITNVFLPFYVVDTSWIEQALPECPNLINALAGPTELLLSDQTDPINPHTVRLDCAYPLSLSDLVERNQPKDHYKEYPALPIHYEGVIYPRSEEAHLLPQSELQLMSLYKDINWDKSYTPILHTVWRQPVAVEQENAYSIPILAGRNLTFNASENNANELELVVSDDTEQLSKQHSGLTNEVPVQQRAQIDMEKIVPQIKASLSDSASLYPDQLKQTQNKAMIDTTSVFEFEGLVTVYIKYINRVPYLHIDAHSLFNTSQALNSEPATIIPHTFKQRRRVISNQVHYFDHPYFGMVIELRRYKRPTLASLDYSNNSASN